MAFIATMAAAGAKFTDVVKMNSYVANMDKAPAVRQMPAKYFGDTPPVAHVGTGG
jgi:enamine deaminase RidA (YjgF/YER057c/UK114 family)